MPSFAIPTALSIPLAWGLYSLMFLQWKDLMLDLVSPLAIKSFKYPSLSVATSIFKPPTPISFKTEAIDLISLSRFPVMTTIPVIPVWIIKITRILQYFPATKSKVCCHWGKCRTLIISSFMMTSPGRSPPTSLYTRVATFVVRPVATSFVLPQKAPQQLWFFKIFWKIWFRFLRNDFFPFS